MKLNQKFILLTILPVVLAMATIVTWVTLQTQDFSQRQAEEFERATIDMRKQQLRDYVHIVQTAVSHLSPTEDASANKKTATELFRILSEIEYSEDGYFYVYDTHGINLVHPKQPFRIGESWLDLKDERGKPVIRSLLAQAQQGGGYTEYRWEKPSLLEISTKIGYSEMLGDWGWMIGTGAYVDDIEKQVQDIQSAMAPHIKHTFNTGALIAAAAVIAVFGSGLLLQINEKKLADKKLRELTRRIILTQDEERRRVSRELHDSISQSLIGMKYMMEEVQLNSAARSSGVDRSLGLITSHLDSTLNEIRRISRDLHPSILDDIGLMAAVEALIESFRSRTGIEVEFKNVKVRNLLPKDARTALYRVVQEALTNIERHADATYVSVQFSIERKWFGVSIEDNGIGFQLKNKEKRAESHGIGLRNISERLSYFDGTCQIDSSPKGTRLFAGVPKTILQRSIREFE